MRTYGGYTVEEIQEMEDQGTCPSHVLIAYINDDYDESDDYRNTETNFS